MKKDLIELYEGYLKYTEEKFQLQEEIDELKKRHKEEFKVLNDKMIEIEKNKDRRDLIKKLNYKDLYYSNPSLTLTTFLKRGQKISSLDYLKKLLEKKIGKELVLVEYTTSYKKIFEEWDHYEKYDVKKTMIDFLFLPKDKQWELYEKFNNMNLDDYKKVIKKLPYVFLIERMWSERESKRNLRFIEGDKRFHLKLDNFNGERASGVFYNDEYNKDIEYDKIILKTFDYCIKSEELEKNLNEQEKLQQELKKHEELQKQLLEKQKKIKDSKESLKDYDITK